MKLVFVTQTLDPEHPALAQTLDLADALARRVDELAVVTRHCEWAVPTNASVRTFDAASRARRVLAFERAIAGATRDAHAVLVHMVPQFALLAAPITRVRRVPLLLWYTHWHASRALRMATRIVDASLSVDASSYPVPTTRLRAIGHAIDVERFDAPPAEQHDGAVRVLALGRTARWKGLATLVEAVELADADLRLEIRGPSLTTDEETHRRELAARVDVRDPVARDEVPELLASVDLVVSPNEPRAGATLDKSVFEAAACRRPVLSTNPAFAPLLGSLPLELIARPRDARALAAALEAFARSSHSDRLAAGEALRSRVVASHSLDHWARSVVEVIAEVRSARGTAGA